MVIPTFYVSLLTLLTPKYARLFCFRGQEGQKGYLFSLIPYYYVTEVPVPSVTLVIVAGVKVC